MKRIIVKIIALLLSLLCVAATWVYYGVWIPARTISDLSTWNPDYGFQGEMPREKIRNACHKLLFNFSWDGGHHDAFLALQKVGNKDSIPYLIRSLKGLERKYPNAITSGFVICTYGHCLEALDALTGMEELGDDHKAWKKWWIETGRYLPFDEEKGQLATGRNSRRNRFIIDFQRQENNE